MGNQESRNGMSAERPLFESVHSPEIQRDILLAHVDMVKEGREAIEVARRAVAEEERKLVEAFEAAPSEVLHSLTPDQRADLEIALPTNFSSNDY